MGRQIRLYQTDEDLLELWDFLHRNSLVVFDAETRQPLRQPMPIGYDYGNKTGIAPIDADLSQSIQGIWDYIVEYSVPHFVKSPRLPSPPIGVVQTREKDRILYTPILPPTTESPIPKGAVAICVARFYLTNEAYSNESAVKTYNLLVKYVKKHYTYSKAVSSYYAPHFERMHKNKTAFPAEGDRVFEIDSGIQDAFV